MHEGRRMRMHRSTISLGTRGWNDVTDITERVESSVQSSGVRDGIVTVFVPGSTAGITTIECEPGAVADLKRAIDRLAPADMHYDHDKRWGDGNGFAHVRAALLGPSLSIPISQGHMELGTWQQIVLIDFDNRPRTREVVILVMGQVMGPSLEQTPGRTPGTGDDR
jgi:secondary thiamine-phosphate synthase enzyme